MKIGKGDMEIDVNIKNIKIVILKGVVKGKEMEGNVKGKERIKGKIKKKDENLKIRG